ncbi:MAG: DNA-binding protein [Candidatus Bathyarchaeia archaeon]
MADLELEMIRYKKLLELKKRLEKKPESETEKPKETSPQEVLDKFFADRAWEVFNAAKAQYPEVAEYVEKTLVKLISEGKIREKITGEDLYGLFLRLGFKVKLQTRINILEHGRIKSLEEKIREENSNL